MNMEIDGHFRLATEDADDSDPMDVEDNGDLDLGRLLVPGVRYYLITRYDDKNGFRYYLHTTLPDDKRKVTIFLDAELGRRLAKVWKDNEYGTPVGGHSMEWIITHLGATEDNDDKQNP